MQEVINEILEGESFVTNGSLDFGCSKIELSLQKGEKYEGAFEFFATPGVLTEGYVTSSDYRMECLTEKFTGTQGQIAYCFHGETMEEGEVVKGTFHIVSNQGEYILPFVVSVAYEVLQTSIGPVKNLFHFANLAKSNWKEAIHLFYSSKFLCLLDGNDEKYYDSYRALSACSGHEQNMEEFLIQINKKQRVEFLVEEQNLELELPPTGGAFEVLEREIKITRNGWGYTVLNVECDGDFLFTEKELLTDDDFLGNRCRLPVYIDVNKCRMGNNFGRVVMYNSYISLEIPVQIKVGEKTAANRGELQKKRTLVKILEYYQDFRLKKINASGWMKETGKLVEQLITMDDRDVTARLFKAQLLITEERYAEANWMLEHTEELLLKVLPVNVLQAEQSKLELWAYYLYLTTLYEKEEGYINEIAAQIDLMYRSCKQSYRLAWLLLYISEEYSRSAVVKWQFIEAQYAYGCTSFAMYIEALQLLNTNPTLLRKLGEFELQVLYYGAKREAVGKELLGQILYLGEKVREFQPVHYKLLTLLYHQTQDVRVLQAVCVLLIKGAKVGERYFEWYRMGVEKQLRITNLYEYFMMSINLNIPQNIPKVVLMYFSYQCSLDDDQTAYLYHYIYENRDRLGELFENYRPKIETFVLDQIAKQRINRHLAQLYNGFLVPELIDERIAKPLSRLVFANCIRVDDLRMRKVLVYHPECLVAREYPMKDGVAWISLYGNDYTICFEDAFGNRFMKNVEYTLEKLMLPGKYMKPLAALVEDFGEFDYFLYESEKKADTVEKECAMRAKRIAQSEEMSDRIRRECAYFLLQYYYASDDMASLDHLLNQISLEQFTPEEKAGIMKYMVLRGNYERAFEWIRWYGPYFVEIPTLVRLLGAILSKENTDRDSTLLAAAAYVLEKGKYNNSILEYLCRYFTGSSKEMQELWTIARDFGVDCYKLSERILIQILYSKAFVGQRMEIYRYYLSQGAKQEINSAFLTQCAYDYFVSQEMTEGYVFREIKNMYKRGETISKICKLAYLKYFADNPGEMEPGTDSAISDWLQEMLKDKIHLNFMKNLKGYGRYCSELLDKTIIEYRAHPGSRARIHYVIMYEGSDEQDYMSEYMEEAYGGVFFKEFVLFFGDSLQYYIMEEEDGREQLTESNMVQKSDVGAEAGFGKYDAINDLIISKTLQDYDTMDEMLESFYRREYYSTCLFKLKLTK